MVTITGEKEDVNFRKALNYALRLLGYRARTIAEMRERLELKGFSDTSIELVLERLQAEGYLNDAEFARNWIESRLSSKPIGRRRVSHELHQKGVPRETISRELEGYLDHDHEVKLAMELVEKRWQATASLSQEKAWQRFSSFLERRGFSPDTIETLRRRLKVL